MTADPIYLDHNATTPIDEVVLEAMLPWLRGGFGNPSSGHVYGQRAKAAIDHARAQVADALGAHPDEVVFTGGGTEANNLAICGLAAAAGVRRFLTSSVEHPATAQPLAHLERQGASVTRLPVDARGIVVLSDAPTQVDLVTVMHANNETGALQPIRALAQRARWAHTDAAQSFGKVPVDVDDLGVDLLSLAGHKLYAPKGIGALYVRRGTPLAPFLRGASHESGRRPGTENVASIVGLGVAAARAVAALNSSSARLAALSEQLWEGLAARIPGLRRHGPRLPDRLPNTLNVGMPGVAGSEVLARCPSVAASTGSACHDGVLQPSAVLLAQGLSASDALGAVRLSLGAHTTEDQVREAVLAVAHAWQDALEDAS